MSTLKSSGVEALVRFYGADVLGSCRMQSEQLFLQHGTVSVFDHSFAVACLGLYLVLALGLRVDRGVVEQYIQLPRIAKDFANYLEL